MTQVCEAQPLMSHQTEDNHSYHEESKMKNIEDFRSEQGDEGYHNKNFISKVYQSILTNMPLQKQMKPILTIYHDLLDDKFNDIKGIGQELINTTKEKLTSWLYNVNIYSHLVGLWILQNSSYSEKITSKEDFLESLRNFDMSKKSTEQDQEEIMLVATRFYEILSTEWSKLKEPTTQDIKHILLHSVAVTIGKGLQQMDDFYAGNLVHAFKDMIEKKRELMSNESFIQVVKQLTGNVWTDDDAFKKATHDFYIFAKRFTLIDLPIVVSPKNVSKALVGYTKDMSTNYADVVLNLVNRYIDTLIDFLSIEVPKEEAISSFRNKTSLVLEKLYLITTNLYSRSISVVTTNKLFRTVDDYIQFRQRFDDISFLAITTIKIFRYNIYEPSQQFAITTYDRLYKEYQIIIYRPIATFIMNKFDIATKQIFITLKIFNIDIEILREKLPSIKETYEYLREATFIIRDSILEIKFDKENLIRYRQQITEQLEALYGELRKMDTDKTKEYAFNLYKNALKTLKERKNQRSITNQPKKIKVF